MKLTQIGLVLNFVGTVLVALSFGQLRNGGYTENEKGKRFEFSYLIHPWWFRVGMFLLAIGFLIQWLVASGYV